METSLIALAIPPLLLVPAMGLLSRIQCKREITGELRRKALHVGTGLVALSFPIYLTTPWMVLTALSVVMVWMIAVRRIAVLRVRFGSCLHDTKRASFGEIYFALSIASLMLLTADRPLFFVIPLLILTLADSAAAIVGRLMPVGPLGGVARGKTMSGCVAFVIVAFLLTQSLLAAFTTMSWFQTIEVALVMACATCIAELISKRGFDNVLIPAVAYATLHFMNVPQISGDSTVAQIYRNVSALISMA
jgi:phytol kinase